MVIRKIKQIKFAVLARAPDSAHAETCIEKEADEKKGGNAGDLRR